MAKTAKSNDTNIQDTLPQSALALKKNSGMIHLRPLPEGRPIADNTTVNMDELIGYLD